MGKEEYFDKLVHIDLNWENCKENLIEIKAKMGKMKTNEIEVGELVARFFYMFGYVIPDGDWTISIKEGRLIPQRFGLLGYSMQDPFVEFHDMCRHLKKESKEYEELVYEFKRGFECIRDGKISVLTEEFKGCNRET